MNCIRVEITSQLKFSMLARLALVFSYLAWACARVLAYARVRMYARAGAYVRAWPG